MMNAVTAVIGGTAAAAIKKLAARATGIDKNVLNRTINKLTTEVQIKAKQSGLEGNALVNYIQHEVEDMWLAELRKILQKERARAKDREIWAQEAEEIFDSLLKRSRKNLFILNASGNTERKFLDKQFGAQSVCDFGLKHIKDDTTLSQSCAAKYVDIYSKQFVELLNEEEAAIAKLQNRTAKIRSYSSSINHEETVIDSVATSTLSNNTGQKLDFTS